MPLIIHVQVTSSIPLSAFLARPFSLSYCNCYLITFFLRLINRDENTSFEDFWSFDKLEHSKILYATFFLPLQQPSYSSPFSAFIASIITACHRNCFPKSTPIVFSAITSQHSVLLIYNISSPNQKNPLQHSYSLIGSITS